MLTSDTNGNRMSVEEAIYQTASGISQPFRIKGVYNPQIPALATYRDGQHPHRAIALSGLNEYPYPLPYEIAVVLRDDEGQFQLEEVTTLSQCNEDDKLILVIQEEQFGSMATHNNKITTDFEPEKCVVPFRLTMDDPVCLALWLPHAGLPGSTFNSFPEADIENIKNCPSSDISNRKPTKLPIEYAYKIRLPFSLFKVTQKNT